MIICAVAAAGLVFVPETAERQRGGLSIRRPRVPAEIRGAFARVSLTAAAVWAVVAGLFLAVMPSYAGEIVLHSRNLALLALMAALVLVSFCAAQLAVRRAAPPAQAQAAGLVLLAAGLLALVLAAPAHSAALLITGAILAGAGHGVAFLAAQDELTRIAPDRQRAEVSAAFYVCIYLGVSVPVIGIGLVAVATTLFTAVTTFAAVTGGGALVLASWHLRNRLNPGSQTGRTSRSSCSRCSALTARTVLTVRHHGADPAGCTAASPMISRISSWSAIESRIRSATCGPVPNRGRYHVSSSARVCATSKSARRSTYGRASSRAGGRRRGGPCRTGRGTGGRSGGGRPGSAR
jgi:MFS family permease